MITDHHYTIPGSADPGSTDDGGHSPDVDTTITTALLLDPTGPGYRLDSKLVAELTAPLPKKVVPLPLFPLFLVLIPFLLGTLVLYSGVEDYYGDTTPSSPTAPTGTQVALISATTHAPSGVQNEFLQLDNVQASHPDSGPKTIKKPLHQRWRMSKFLLGFSTFCNIALMFFWH